MAKDDSMSADEKLIALLIGAGIGATLALLFAPKSGRELRGDIADYSKRGFDIAGERARVIGERATELYGSEAGRASEVYGTAADKVSEAYRAAREKVLAGAETVSDVAARQKEQIAAAIEAGKQAYREEKRKVGEASGVHGAGEGPDEPGD